MVELLVETISISIVELVTIVEPIVLHIYLVELFRIG